MAKYRRKRRYYRRKIWSTNIKDIDEQLRLYSSGSTITGITLCSNPQQADNTVSQKYTVKNVELSYQIDTTDEVGPEKIESISVYICYVPQGFSIDNYFIKQHPEYIMAYRFLGNPNSDVDTFRNPLFIKTRLARTLNTGDEIKLLIYGNNEDSVQKFVNIHGVLRWWTKAN